MGIGKSVNHNLFGLNYPKVPYKVYACPGVVPPTYQTATHSPDIEVDGSIEPSVIETQPTVETDRNTASAQTTEQFRSNNNVPATPENGVCGNSQIIQIHHHHHHHQEINIQDVNNVAIGRNSKIVVTNQPCIAP